MVKPQLIVWAAVLTTTTTYGQMQEYHADFHNWVPYSAQACAVAFYSLILTWQMLPTVNQ